MYRYPSSWNEYVAFLSMCFLTEIALGHGLTVLCAVCYNSWSHHTMSCARNCPRHRLSSASSSSRTRLACFVSSEYNVSSLQIPKNARLVMWQWTSLLSLISPLSPPRSPEPSHISSMQGRPSSIFSTSLPALQTVGFGLEKSMSKDCLLGVSGVVIPWLIILVVGSGSFAP